MKAVIFENPRDHRVLLADPLLDNLCFRNVDVTLAKTVEEADTLLARGGVDFVVIHHAHNEEVDRLRQKYPRIFYAAYTSTVPGAHMIPGSIGEALVKKFNENYDFVFSDLTRSIHRLMTLAEQHIASQGKGVSAHGL